MTDDYPSFGDSSLFGANVYYRGTVALGRNDPSGTRLRGGAPKGRHAWHVGLLGRSLTSPPLVHLA